MDDACVANAREARSSVGAPSRAMVVTGDDSSRRYWGQALSEPFAQTQPNAVTVIAERGRKGNFLGALQAYERMVGNEFGAAGPLAFDQLVMMVGTGSRLSPITQSLRNMKSALVLPSNDGERSHLTVGEAAIRSSAPWVRVLREGGFQGLVLRWGDEIIVPSTVLASERSMEFANIDVVRFGYEAKPNEILATQKEWLLCDESRNVYAELPRQSLRGLLDRVSTFRSAKTLHVNLGSFAASHHFLTALSQAFGDLLNQDSVAANWDPYLWIALHSPNRAEWEEACRAGKRDVPQEFAALLAGIPDFWSRVQQAKMYLEKSTGRKFAAKLLDFGDPFWFDAGNHASLRAGINAIFTIGRDGDTVRAFLGLPDTLTTGENFISNSVIAEGVSIRNSVVIGSQVKSSASFAERSVIINSRLGNVSVDPGGVVIECHCEMLSVDGPHGFAFRLEGRAHVAGNEVSAEVKTTGDGVRLSYFNIDNILDVNHFEKLHGSNPISFKEAAVLADSCGLAQSGEQLESANESG